MTTVPIYDATGANASHLPAGQRAGYVTGSGGVAWPESLWQANPGAVRIDQSPVASMWDTFADVQDYETGAVTLAEVPARMRAAHAAYHAGARPGQRLPAVYVGAQPNATPVVNALIAAGIRSGVPLAVAAPGMSDSDAVALVESTAATPWPIIWVQNGWHGTYDSGHASAAWLSAVVAGPRRLVSVTVAFDSGSPAVYHA